MKHRLLAIQHLLLVFLIFCSYGTWVVQCQPPPPANKVANGTAVASVWTVQENSRLLLTLQGNATANEGGTQGVLVINTNPMNGSLYDVVQSGDMGARLMAPFQLQPGKRQVYYVPDTNFYGINTFVYAIEWQYTKTPFTLVTVNVTFVDQAPTLVETSQSISFSGTGGSAYDDTTMLNMTTIRITARDVDQAAIDPLKVVFTSTAPDRGQWFSGPSGTSRVDFIQPVLMAGIPGSRIFVGTLRLKHDNAGGAYPYYAQLQYYVMDKYGLASTANGSISVSVVCSLSRYNRIWASTGTACGTCPTGAICSQSGALFPMNAAGYYPDQNQKNTEIAFLSCPVASACPEGMFATSSLQEFYALNVSCGTGYTGLRCGACASGYYRSSGACLQCASSQKSLAVLIGVVIAGIVGGLVLLSLIRVVDIGFFGIMISFFQTLALFKSFKITWPTLVTSTFNAFSFLNFNLDMLAPECLSASSSTTTSTADTDQTFELKWFIIVGIPVGFMVIVLLLLGWHCLMLQYGVPRALMPFSAILMGSPAPSKVVSDSDTNQKQKTASAEAKPSEIKIVTSNVMIDDASPATAIPEDTQDIATEATDHKPEASAQTLPQLPAEPMLDGVRQLMHANETTVNPTEWDARYLANVYYRPSTAKAKPNTQLSEAQDEEAPLNQPSVQKKEYDDKGMTGSRAIPIRAISLYLLFLRFMYLSLARKTLELFECESIGQYSFFSVEPYRLCYADWWHRLLPYAILSSLIFVIGVPALVLVLQRKRNHLIMNTLPSSRTKWQRLLLQITFKRRSEFKEQFDYWNSVILLRKLLIVLSQLFFSQYVAFESVLMVLVLVVALMAQIRLEPYAAPSLNFLETTTLFASILIMLCGVLFYVQEFPQSQLDTLGVVVLIAIICTVGAVVFAFGVHVKFLYLDYRVRQKQENASKNKVQPKALDV